MGIPLAPAVPRWVMLQREAAMQVDEGMLKCSVFLGTPNERGFAADGSGFFMFVSEEEMDFTYVITCRHVIRPFEPPRSTVPNADSIWIRVNTQPGVAPRSIETVRGDWIPHEDRFIDICVYPWDHTKWDYDDKLDIGRLEVHSVVLHKEIEELVGLSLGDEVFIPGCFVGRVGERRNIPVIRVGHIAALPYEPVWGGSPRKPAYLIETKSLGGISGSPVFLHIAPMRQFKPVTLKMPDGREASPYFLIGIMQGLHSGQYATDFVSEHDEEKIVPTETDFNAGIGIAIPIVHVLETINQPKLKEARLAALKAKRKETGYHPASSSDRTKVFGTPPSLSADDTNPHHREDFTSLLTEAARKREPEA